MLSVGEIKDILRREHISISKRRGQNFLVDPWAQKKIIDALDLKPTDEILEIGSGLGALTEDLAGGAAKVTAVEKDRGLARILQAKLSGYKNLRIICEDILRFGIKNKVKAVGNLPYYITTPIIAYLLEQQRKNLKEIFITVQNEVGRRLAAKKGSKEYSALTVLVQYFTEPKVLFSIPKKAFYPQPKVDSVFVRLRVLENPRVKVNNQEHFFKIVRACFNQRRKTIINSLSHKLSKTRKAEIARALTEAGIDVRMRPERLSLDEFAKITQVIFTSS